MEPERQAELLIVDELITVEPGSMARTTLKIRNVSDRVVNYKLSPVPSSPAAGWITIAPNELRLLDAEDGEAEVFVQPPQGQGSQTGRVPYAVIADPGADVGVVPAVAEADVAVGAVHALDARLVPRQAKGRLRGRLRLELTNRGNEDLRVSVTASDDADDENLHFATADGRISVPRSGSADAFLKVRPDRPILMGKPVDHPFTVRYARRAPRSAQLATADEGEQVHAEVPGVWTQKPLVAKWMIVVAALIAAIVAVVILVNRARAVDPPRTAPDPPRIVDDAEITDGVLSVTIEVDQEVDAIELDIIDSLDEPIENATQLDGDVVGEDIESSTVVSFPLSDERLEEAGPEVFFRLRSKDNDQPSIWIPGSAPTEDAPFGPPREVVAAWSAQGTVRVSWSPPESDQDRTFTYGVGLAGSQSEILVGITDTFAEIPFTDPNEQIRVRARDSDDPELPPSAWSELTSVTGTEPTADTIPAPTDVAVAWDIVDDDPNFVTIAFTPLDPAVTGDPAADIVYQVFAEGNQELASEIVGPGERRVEMPSDGPFPIAVRAVVTFTDGREPQRSPLSEFAEPQGDSIPIPTTPTTPPTTDPPVDRPQGFWILMQGGIVPTSDGEAAEWTALLDLPPGAMTKTRTEMAGVFETRASFNGVPLFEEGTEVVFADSFPDAASARVTCEQFLVKFQEFLVGTEDEGEVSRCFVLDESGATVDEVAPQ